MKSIKADANTSFDEQVQENKNFIKKICEHYKIDQETYSKYFWSSHGDKYRGFDIRGYEITSSGKSFNKEETLKFIKSKNLWFTDLWDSLFDNDFTEILDDVKWYTIIKVNKGRIIVKTEKGVELYWERNNPTPTINHLPNYMSDKVIEIGTCDEEYGFYEIADYFYDDHYFKSGKQFRAIERE